MPRKSSLKREHSHNLHKTNAQDHDSVYIQSCYRFLSYCCSRQYFLCYWTGCRKNNVTFYSPFYIWGVCYIKRRVLLLYVATTSILCSYYTFGSGKCFLLLLLNYPFKISSFCHLKITPCVCLCVCVYVSLPMWFSTRVNSFRREKQ
jgi:hypothetical protein